MFFKTTLIPLISMLVATAVQGAQVHVWFTAEAGSPYDDGKGHTLLNKMLAFDLDANNQVAAGVSFPVHYSKKPGELITTTCSFKGALDKQYRDISWIITDDPSYVHPCDNHHGMVLDCVATSTCHPFLVDGTSITYFREKLVSDPDENTSIRP